LAAKAEAWRAQNEALHSLFDSTLTEPLPARMRRVIQQNRRPATWRRAAAMAWLVLGPAAGWFAHTMLAPAPTATALAQLPQLAAVAHAVYAPEVIHPVEVSADQEKHLVQWLSKRLDTPLHTPDLSDFGYALTGGRLLPGNAGPAAQFMYQNAQGARLTLYVSIRENTDGHTAFRYAREDGVSVLYWIDGRLGYALSGEVEQKPLLSMGEAVYRQLGL